MRQNRTSILSIAIGVFCLIGFCFYLYLAEIQSIVQQTGLSKGALENAGLLGDSTGLMNALFSGLAFGGVLLTIIWQIHNDNKRWTINNKTQFENTFFNMTQTFEHIIESLSIETFPIQKTTSDDFSLKNFYDDPEKKDEPSLDKSTKRIVGRSVFKHIYNERKLDSKTLQESLSKSGLDAYENFIGGFFDHYFRYLYRILKLVDNSELIDDQQKYRYAAILRALLSEYELVMIYYNGLTKGKEKLKPLIEKYSLLKNLRKEDLAIAETTGQDVPSSSNNCVYQDAAYNHYLSYSGNSPEILVSCFLYSVIAVLILSLSENIIDDFIFKDFLSSSIFTSYSGEIISLFICMMIATISKHTFYNLQIKVKPKGYKKKWDEVRYILSCYYDSQQLRFIIPVVVSLLFLCGKHEWYGYGFLLYVNLILAWLLIKPFIATLFTIHNLFAL